MRRLANGLVLTARAADGVIEGAESEDGSAFVGVQWHPENLWRQDPTQLALFTDLVERAEAAR